MRRITVLLAAGAALGLAGCSSGAKTDDQSAAIQQAATTYQQAVNARDWQAACTLSSPALRGGSVAHCVANNTLPTGNTSPDPVPSGIVGSYADGSTPPPMATPAAPSGPAYASTGTITADSLVQLPSSGTHPAGWGIAVTYTVTWPGQPPTTDRRALRLIQQGSAWVVDQSANTMTADSTDQVLAALEG